MMIDGDRADLVDKDGTVRQGGLTQQAVEQLRLAAAEKAGQYMQRQLRARQGSSARSDRLLGEII
jgi:hypothetical protein